MAIPLKNALCAIGVIAVSGALRLKPEQACKTRLVEEQLQEPPPALELRDQMGQSFYLASLGGFRSLIASLVEVEGMTGWQQLNYGKVDACYALCCELQPRDLHYWDFRYWMLAKNASHYFRFVDGTRGEVGRAINQRYVDKGIEVLEKAEPWVGNDWRYWRTLGDALTDIHYNSKLDWSRAADAYAKALTIPDCMSFVQTLRVRALAQSPGREGEAWDLLVEMYKDPEHPPVVKALLCVIHPEIVNQRPNAKLPAELAPHADTARKMWRDQMEKQKKLSAPRIESHALQPTVN